VIFTRHCKRVLSSAVKSVVTQALFPCNTVCHRRGWRNEAVSFLCDDASTLAFWRPQKVREQLNQSDSLDLHCGRAYKQNAAIGRRAHFPISSTSESIPSRWPADPA